MVVAARILTKNHGSRLHVSSRRDCGTQNQPRLSRGTQSCRRLTSARVLRVSLRRRVHDRQFRVIGSRVTGRAKRFSDLDLVIMGDVALPLRVCGELRDDLDESNLPFTVDLVEWATASDEFSRVVVRDARPLLPPA